MTDWVFDQKGRKRARSLPRYLRTVEYPKGRDVGVVQLWKVDGRVYRLVAERVLRKDQAC